MNDTPHRRIDASLFCLIVALIFFVLLAMAGMDWLFHGYKSTTTALLGWGLAFFAASELL